MVGGNTGHIIFSNFVFKPTVRNRTGFETFRFPADSAFVDRWNRSEGILLTTRALALHKVRIQVVVRGNHQSGVSTVAIAKQVKL